MDLDELDNGLRVRHIPSGRTGTIYQLVDVVEVILDDGTAFEVSEFGDFPPADLEPIGDAP